MSKSILLLIALVATVFAQTQTNIYSLTEVVSTPTLISVVNNNIDSVGDYRVYNNLLFLPGGYVVGDEKGICVRTKTMVMWDCEYVVSFLTYQLIIQGSVPDGANTTEFAIVGGIGQFAGARGEVTWVAGSSGNNMTFEINLNGPATNTTTTTLFEIESTDTTIHVGPNADNVGDRLIFADPLTDSTNSSVGKDEGICTRAIVGSYWTCQFMIYLSLGDIDVRGVMVDGKNNTLSIVGGTGRYAGVRGDMDVNIIATGVVSYVLRIQLDAVATAVNYSTISVFGVSNPTLIQAVPSGINYGDRYIYHDQITKADGVTVLGYNCGYCTRTAPSEWQCTGNLNINSQGSIIYEGSIYDNVNTTMAITGGTFNFKNARGDLQWKVVSNSQYNMVLRVESDVVASNNTIVTTTGSTGYTITGFTIPPLSDGGAGIALGVFFGLAIFILFVFVISVACVNDARRRQGRPPLSI